MAKSVLFVCTGNTCRSVMAEYLLRHYAQELDLNIEAASAGLAAFGGDTATEQTVAALGELGIEAGSHRSRRMHAQLLQQYDLILAMTEQHRRALLELVPAAERHELSEKVILLKEYGERKASSGQDLGGEIEKDIQDPFGQPLDIYRRIRDEIAGVVKQMVGHWALKKEKKMRIVIGADHGGFGAKREVVQFLRERGSPVEDWGTHSEESCDYPDIAHKVARAVAAGDFDLGILICGTGIGVSMSANKVPGIRAALCHDTYSARMARKHNDSNVLCLGERVTGIGLMQDIVAAYLNSEFEGGRHSRRVEKIEQLD